MNRSRYHDYLIEVFPIRWRGTEWYYYTILELPTNKAPFFPTAKAALQAAQDFIKESDLQVYLKELAKTS